MLLRSALAPIALVALLGLPSMAAVIPVTTLLDTSGGPACTLRDAITAAETDVATGSCAAGSGADSIDLSALAGVITLIAPLPTLGSSDRGIEIVGPGAALLAVSGNGLYVVFTNTGAFAVSRIAGVTIRDGFGHCVYAEGRTRIEDARVTGCSGGAALDTGEQGFLLRVERTLIDNNADTAIRVGGFSGSGGLLLVNSTVSGNAGGIFIQNADGPGGQQQIYASTLADNGVANLKIGFNQQALLDGVLMLGASGRPPTPNCVLQGVSDPVTLPPNLTSSNSLDNDGSCGLVGSGDQERVDPLLEALSENGGPTRTRALLEGSPAIDAGASPCNGPDGPLTVDQRGLPRPQGAACDIGAFEVPEAAATLAGIAAIAALRALRRCGRSC